MIKDIHGLQKMTLLDYPGKVAATVFLGGCDLHCPFCHNYELATGETSPVMSVSGLMDFLEKRKGLLDGVAITGGEPCIHKGLEEFVRAIREKGFLIKLDTNGFHPDVLGHLLTEGLLDYVAVDIKNSPSKYARTCGLETLDLTSLYESIDLLMKSYISYEFRTTVVKGFHEEEDFHEMGKMIKGAREYYLQQFVLRDTVPCRGLDSPGAVDMSLYLDIARQYVPNAQIRGLD